MGHTQAHGRKTRRAGLALLVSFGLLAAGCGNKKDDETSSDTVEDTADTEVVVESDTTTVDPSGDTVVEESDTTDAPAAEDEGTPVPGGRLVVSGEAKVASPWTPAKMQCDSYCQQRARTIYDPVAAVGADGEVHPFLAESIEPNADFSEWTIKIRDGISFSDGTPVDGAAVLQNLNATGTGLLVSAALVDLAKGADGLFKSEVVDGQTFTLFTGKGGDPAKPIAWKNFPYALTGQWGLIASPTWLDAVAAGTADETKGIGSGPFVLSSFADDKMVVTKNPTYWQKDADGVQLPYLDEIEFRVIDDSETAASALESGDIDVFSTSAARVISDFREIADEFPMVEQADFTETNYGMMHFSQTGTELTDKRVRCALNMAIDRQELIDSTGGGILEPANGLFSPGQEGYLEDNGLSIEQDIDGATALIEEYEAETGQQVTITWGKTTSAINDEVAELIKGYWDAIGVDTEIITVEQASSITNALLGVPDFEIYGWRNHGGVTIDQQYFWWHSSAIRPDGDISLNFGRLNDPVVDAGLDEAREALTPEDSKAAAEKVNAQMGAECYNIPMSWTLWGTPHAPKVHGFGTFAFPDGTLARDGAGFGGSFWVNTLWVSE